MNGQINTRWLAAIVANHKILNVSLRSSGTLAARERFVPRRESPLCTRQKGAGMKFLRLGGRRAHGLRHIAAS